MTAPRRPRSRRSDRDTFGSTEPETLSERQSEYRLDGSMQHVNLKDT